MEFKALQEAVSLQVTLQKELLGVLERETGDLSGVNIAAMNQDNQVKEELLQKIARNSQLMRQEIAAAAGRLGLPADAPLGILAERLAPQGCPQLLEQQRALRDTAARVKRAATMNHEIAERFAGTIATSLRLITRLINQSNMYGASGGYQKSPTGAVMINREA